MHFVNKISLRSAFWLYFIGGNLLLSILVRLITHSEELGNFNIEERNKIIYFLILFNFLYSLLSFALFAYKAPLKNNRNKIFVFSLYFIITSLVMFFAGYASPISIILSYALQQL